MRQLDPDALGALQYGNRRSSTRDQSDDRPRGCALWRIRRIDQRIIDERRAAHVGDAVFRDQLENLGGIDLAQANIDARCRSDRPGEAPAVTVEHWQGPEIHRMLPEIAGEDVADGVEGGAAVVGYHAFGMACRSRGVK